MEIDGGGWMLWNEYNTTVTSMNEALGGSSTSPHSGLGRGNYNNYARYQVLIRASKIDDGESIDRKSYEGMINELYSVSKEIMEVSGLAKKVIRTGLL